MIAFTRDQEDFRKSVARFVDAEVAPAAQALASRMARKSLSVIPGLIPASCCQAHEPSTAA